MLGCACLTSTGYKSWHVRGTGERLDLTVAAIESGHARGPDVSPRDGVPRVQRGRHGRGAGPWGRRRVHLPLVRLERPGADGAMVYVVTDESDPLDLAASLPDAPR